MQREVVMAAPSELRQTRTYVTMDVPPELYDLVRQKLLDAGYGHAVDDKEGELDMHGIALVKQA
jgi:hypothetical protein